LSRSVIQALTGLPGDPPGSHRPGGGPQRRQTRAGAGGPRQPARSAEHLGLGLRLMCNRAAVIGARLTIEPVQPSGTRVTCVLAGKIEGGGCGSAWAWAL